MTATLLAVAGLLTAAALVLRGVARAIDRAVAWA